VSLVVDKATRLIDLVAAGHDTLNALVKESQLSRSTTHRLLSSLVERGYLSYDARHYELGYRLLELGEIKRRSLRFLEALRPTLNRYSEITRDTIHVAILDGTDIVLIERIAGQRELQINSFVGQRATAFMTAVGKTLIGRQSPEAWAGYLRKIPKGYAKTPAQVRVDLEIARKRNFAVDIDEVSIGTCGVASAFRVHDALHAAVSINGATVYFGNGRLRELAEVAIRLAGELEEILQRQARSAA
jgi:DNA-binding IclR family transcriptional regulator